MESNKKIIPLEPETLIDPSMDDRSRQHVFDYIYLAADVNNDLMGDCLILSVDTVIPPKSSEPLEGSQAKENSGDGSYCHVADASTSTNDVRDMQENGDGDEEEPLIQTVECRICQEEDSIKNLETPCACSGSLKFAHRKCVQRWCNEKGDITCEICHQPYQPGYTAPPPPARSEDTVIDIRHIRHQMICARIRRAIRECRNGGWTIAGTPLDLHDPRLLAMAAAERRLLEAEHDEYDESGASGAAFCRSAALILMALLLLRHALTIGGGDGDGDGDEDDASTFFALFLLRAAGFLLPCYIMAWAISILQRRRQRQEAAALAAAEVAFMLQAGQHRGLQVTIAPPPAAAPSTPMTPAPTATSGSVVAPSHELLQ
ncbi:hypothetical protein RJ639_042078 [Escallonia herrerae]|uniref:RING-CH-type domain-containing protein n=1 Tax=Escallonia herrerae TaxID=1293975 RepID=A0AA88WHV2_9ASTE|nr:hypothetical protein RJ639_042078 [Escallonia herrerae]